MPEKKQYFHLVGEDLIEFTEEEYKAHKEAANKVRKEWLKTPKGKAYTEKRNENRRNKRRLNK